MQYPKHVAVIPDGNRTRAKLHEKSVAEAYMTSYEKALDLIRYTFTQTEVKIFTLRGLSTENGVKRPKEEFDFLMNMYKLVEEDLDGFLHDQQINFKPIGNFDGITQDFKEYLLAKQQRNTYPTDKYFVFAINYGGRDEIVRGIQTLAKQGIDMQQISEQQLSQVLDLGNIAPIELVIRTKGDVAKRTSGFMSRWIGYAELFFTEKKCPELEIEDYQQALQWFDQVAQERNFGK
ncbi:MAG: polyprenyl diphosphate synthase [bacterium]